MLMLILFLLLGSGLVYVAQNNLVLVPLHLGPYVFAPIPLFYIIVGSLLVGLALAYIVHLVNAIFTAFAMHGRDAKIKKGNSDIVELTKRIHQLELENERLKNHSSPDAPHDANAL